jgi:NADPH-dependent 2,4-dienoyl-CoA reductase/sulfur reductase-like enzyme
MTTYKYMILGGGLAAGYAAQAFAEAYTPPGKLCILSAENKLPYERPPLSKDFLAGEKTTEDILINEPEFYEKNNIDIHLNSRVWQVDLQRKQLYTADNKVFGFEKLLIATGARPRHLDVPGADMKGIYYLRRVEDAKEIRQAADSAKEAVVIGGSFIGMEVASVLQSADVKVTMVFPEEHVWDAFFTPEMSTFFENYYRERGVIIMPKAQVTGFEGENGRLTHVVLDNDSRLRTDMAVAGIGVQPNTQLFADEGLQFIEDGIAVNRFLETNLPDIYAAGDIACYNDVVFEQPRRLEHWDNAMAQGQHAIKNMLGIREPFVHVPYFFSDVFDLSYEFWGDAAGAQQVVHRGDVANGRFSVWWLGEDGRLLAAFVMNRPDEERELAPPWIRERVKLAAEKLVDEDQPLSENVKQFLKEI